MRRLIALTTVVAALALGVASATASPPTPLDQGAKLCQRQGGEFTGFSSTGYICVKYPFTDREVTQGGRLCERNGGLFETTFLPTRYDCYLSL